MSFIKDTLLVKEIINSEKEIILRCKECAIKTYEQEIVVWWKRSWHWMNTKNIGDGIQIVRLHERDILSFHLSLDNMIMGMSLYQEFDEYEGRMKTYFYRFSKEVKKMVFVKNILLQYTDIYHIEKKGNFIILSGPSGGGNSEKISHILTSGGIQGIVSFLFGVILVYGSFDIEQGVLHSARIQLPLVGSIVGFEKILEQMQDILTEYGIYTTSNILQQKYGQLRQMHIGDRELLYIFAKFLNITIVSKFITMKQQKSSLLEYLGESGSIEIREKLENGVVKLVRR